MKKKMLHLCLTIQFILFFQFYVFILLFEFFLFVNENICCNVAKIKTQSIIFQVKIPLFFFSILKIKVYWLKDFLVLSNSNYLKFNKIMQAKSEPLFS